MLPQNLPPLLSGMLELAVEKGGSDIHVKAGSLPRIRINGLLRPIRKTAVSVQEAEAIVFATMNAQQKEDFERDKELDYAIAVEGLGRFRINAYFSRGQVGLVARIVNSEPIPLENLGMPDAVAALAGELNGLIIVAGATGSGKTTTLAGMLDLINRTKPVNIVTIEDPIEFIYVEQRASIIQRELYSDTNSFSNALRASLRQDPDVILIGEMRDKETVETALHAAETGHLVLSTLHTNSAGETIDRLVDFFAPTEQAQIRGILSSTLRGVICQRLVETKVGGRQAAVEILVNRGRVPEAIANPSKYDLYKLITEGRALGMQTFEDHLVDLVSEGKIDKAIALSKTTKRHSLELKLSSRRID